MNEMNLTLKSIPLENRHIALGAKMGPFGGWNMPVQYPEGIIKEHKHTRNHVSIFDCSHMGQFRLRGDKVSSELDKLFPRLVSNQRLNSCRYNFLLSGDGTVRDDLIVYKISEKEFYIVVNGATIESDFDYIRDYLSKSIECINESGNTIKLDVQGPKSISVLKKFDLHENILPKYYRFIHKKINGVPCLISRTGYTGELGFELYFDIQFREKLWGMFMDCAPIKPAGLGARDTLRLEMGYPLYGHELNNQVTPVEAGFEKILDLNHDFIGKNALIEKHQRNLVGIRFQGRRAFRKGTLIYDSNEQIIGEVTSGSYSPSLNCAIALAYLDKLFDLNNKNVFCRANDKLIPGAIESMPFYKYGTVRT